MVQWQKGRGPIFCPFIKTPSSKQTSRDGKAAGPQTTTEMAKSSESTYLKPMKKYWWVCSLLWPLFPYRYDLLWNVYAPRL